MWPVTTIFNEKYIHIGEHTMIGANCMIMDSDDHPIDPVLRLRREPVKAEDIKPLLAPIIARYARERNDGERFGDFCIRAGYVNATVQGKDFHHNIKPEALKAGAN